jgi:dTDP-4-dehydrorhamnose 3,5-epimerase/CDP-3, 6-dideoxy-D-glycero-D-glycero-4-hexulose-5-epimerase
MNRPTINASIHDVKHFSSKQFNDNRGSLTKIWSASWNGEEEFASREFFYSDSLPGVVRGMHFQMGGAACSRYISVLTGKILDVVLDLRPSSPTYLNFHAVEMDPHGTSTVFVPSGVAHGFQALKESRTLYVSGESHIPSLDTGINSDSFGFKWPIKNPIRSARDESLIDLSLWLQENI